MCAKEINRLGPMDLKVYSLKRNSQLELDSRQSLHNITKIFFVTSISFELLLDLPDGANGGSGLIDSSLWGKIFLRLLLTNAAAPLLALPDLLSSSGKRLTSDTMKLVN